LTFIKRRANINVPILIYVIGRDYEIARFKRKFIFNLCCPRKSEGRLRPPLFYSLEVSRL